MPSAPASTMTVPVPDARECRPGAHQALLSPNGKDTYFVTELQTGMLDPGEPLARFLPPAAFVPAGRGMPGGRVVYHLPEAARRGGARLRPPQHALPGDLLLPRAEIEAFAAAVQVFLAGAHPGAAELSPLQQQCRRELRLPHPDLEPDAYWIYGNDFDRKLLVLWGCERFARTALPLEAVVSELRTREMAWEDKQELALKLALREDEALGKFLGVPRADGSLLVGGEMIPESQLQRFVHIGKAECDRFEAAAREFCARSEVAEIPPFEGELRRALRLPGLDVRPGSFFNAKPRFVIAVDRWSKIDTVPPIRGSGPVAPALPYAPATVAEPVAPRPEIPLVDQLRAKIGWSPPTWAKYAAAAVIALGLGLGGWGYVRGGQPPRLLAREPTWDGDKIIVVEFDRAIDAGSANTRGAFEIADNERKVVAAEPARDDPRKVRITVDKPMDHGSSYAVTASTLLKGRNGKPLAAMTSTPQFRYEDRKSPTLEKIAKGNAPNELVLVFDKDMKEKTPKSGIEIAPSIGDKRGDSLELLTVARDSEDRHQLIVTAKNDFKTSVSYVLTLTEDVADVHNNTARVPAALGRFTFADILPPRIAAVKADFGTLTIDVSFNKAVDAARAIEAQNYRVVRADKRSELRFQTGVKFEDALNVVHLPIEAAHLESGSYELIIEHLRGQNGKETRGAKTFEIMTDTNPPAVSRIRLLPDATRPAQLEVEFDHALEKSAALRVANYEILDGRMDPVDVSYTALPGAHPNKVVLALNHPLSAGPHHLAYRDLAAVVGGKQTQVAYADFAVEGLPAASMIVLNWNGDPRRDGQKVVLKVNCELTPDSVSNQKNYRFIPAAGDFTIDHQVDHSTSSPYSIVTLTFEHELPAGLKVGAQQLRIKGLEHYGVQRLITRAVQ